MRTQQQTDEETSKLQQSWLTTCRISLIELYTLQAAAPTLTGSMPTWLFAHAGDAT